MRVREFEHLLEKEYSATRQFMHAALEKWTDYGYPLIIQLLEKIELSIDNLITLPVSLVVLIYSIFISKEY